MSHHTTQREVAPGVWHVARPAPLTSPVERWRRSRECRREFGHCWHPEGLIDWWCCMCSAETDGMPPQHCAFCADNKVAS